MEVITVVRSVTATLNKQILFNISNYINVLMYMKSINCAIICNKKFTNQFKSVICN